MSKISAFVGVIFLVFAAAPAVADDWTGQTPPPPVTGSIGPTDAVMLQSQHLIVLCSPAFTPPPCTPGQTPVYQGSGVFTQVPAIPAAAGPGSNLGVFFAGAYTDPTSPSGLSSLGGNIPLAAFARSTTVDALSSTVGTLGTSFNALSATVGTLGSSMNALSTNVGALSSQMQSLSLQFNQMQQQVQLQDRDLRQGVAMSLAMDGVGDLGPDERFAISMNLGTFGGQNGMAAGVAYRAADHLTFNGGIGTGVNGGLVGARAGVRMAW